MLRNELAQKNVELVEMESRLKQANEVKEDYRKKFETMKKDLIVLKKTIDKEKEN